VVVVGLGRTGEAAARMLLSEGASVLVSEAGSEADCVDAAAELGVLGAECEFGGHSLERFATADTVVLSPGVPQSIEAVAAARDAGRRVISELELAFEYARAPIVAVTGTNGKTTTCTLIHRMLDCAGLCTVYAGNTDMPFSEAVAADHVPEVYVLEVSSFQLELIETFRPEIGVLLNVTPDHLERYDGFDHYAAAKRRIFAHQVSSDYAVVNAGDPVAADAVEPVVSQPVFFDTSREVETGCWVADGRIHYRLVGQEGTVCSTDTLRIPGLHNVENALAACAAALLMGSTPEDCAVVLSEFPGLDHRLEVVAEFGGVTYVNDSKSTNIDSLKRALMAFDRPVVLIAGGRGKGESYDTLRPLVERRVHAAVFIGEEARAMDSALGDVLTVCRAESLDEAVHRAADLARPGDVVLLSPACASFDMFTSFKHRGTVFKESVRALEGICDVKRT